MTAEIRPMVIVGATRPSGLPSLRGHLESLEAGALRVRASSRPGRAARVCTAPWLGRCGRAGGGSGT